MAMDASAGGISYVSAVDAAAIDELLMGPDLGFSIDQLMELAGLSVATATAEHFPLSAPSQPPRVLIVSGPGNNGGDGLVAARHLHHFGYAVSVCYPKPTPKPLYQNLVKQLGALAIPVSSELPASLDADFDVVLDAIFGFSFKGEVRAPFGDILAALKTASVPVVSVDIPSGWDVDQGDPSGEGLDPAVLISLTAPKPAAKSFTGAHYLGGRFVPPAIRDKYNLRLPPYPGRQPATLKLQPSTISPQPSTLSPQPSTHPGQRLESGGGHDRVFQTVITAVISFSRSFSRSFSLSLSLFSLCLALLMYRARCRHSHARPTGLTQEVAVLETQCEEAGAASEALEARVARVGLTLPARSIASGRVFTVNTISHRESEPFLQKLGYRLQGSGRIVFMMNTRQDEIGPQGQDHLRLTVDLSCLGSSRVVPDASPTLASRLESAVLQGYLAHEENVPPPPGPP